MFRKKKFLNNFSRDAELLDPTVPIVQPEVTEEAAHIYESCDRV